MLLLKLAAAAQAAQSDPLVPAAPAAIHGVAAAEDPGIEAPAAASSPAAPSAFWERANLFGDMGGLRTLLGSHGISIGLTETSEVLGNVTGGIRRGAAYDGLTTFSVELDTANAFHWEGGTFLVSALQIHGRSLSASNLGNLQTASGIEADRATRLWELWYEQAFPDGTAGLKIGLQSIDQEFIVSQYAGLYMNTMMGWPMLPSADLYAGGPAYPLSSPGVRFRIQPMEPLTLLGGAFDDNPPGGPFGDDSQLRGREAYGSRFNLTTGTLFIGEAQYAVNRSDSVKISCEHMHCGLPGVYKFGGWYDTAGFPDQRFDAAGMSLADPASSGNARMRRGNFSIYGVVDQMVWRAADGPRSVGVFGRIMGAHADRNLIDWSINAGVNMKAPLPGRTGDTFGIGYGWAHVSTRAGDLDKDRMTFSGTAIPIRSSETFIELTYQAQIAPWWTVQPDLQYVRNPGGGLLNPVNPSERIGDELVFGLRTTLTF